jgi:hypothetical protein
MANQHVALLILLLLGGLAVMQLVLGWAVNPRGRLISKEDDPTNYWWAVGGQAAVVVAAVAMSLYRGWLR